VAEILGQLIQIVHQKNALRDLLGTVPYFGVPADTLVDRVLPPGRGAPGFDVAAGITTSTIFLGAREKLLEPISERAVANIKESMRIAVMDVAPRSAISGMAPGGARSSRHPTDPHAPPSIVTPARGGFSPDSRPISALVRSAPSKHAASAKSAKSWSYPVSDWPLNGAES